jgi:hypothetical protein
VAFGLNGCGAPSQVGITPSRPSPSAAPATVDLTSLATRGVVTLSAENVPVFTPSLATGGGCRMSHGDWFLRSRDPATTLVVSRPTKVFISSAHPVLLRSEATSLCLGDGGQPLVTEVELAPGRYGVFPQTRSMQPATLAMTLRDPSAGKTAAMAEDFGLPALHASAGGLNPLSAQLSGPTHGPFPASWVAPCATNIELLYPVADLTVTDSATFDLESVETTKKTVVVAVGRDGSCAMDRGDLKPGSYRLFLGQLIGAERGWASFDGELRISTKDYPTSYGGDARSIVVDASTPVTSMIVKSAARRGSHECGGGAAPVATVKLEEADVDHDIELLFADREATLAILGPEGHAECRRPMENGSRIMNLHPGTYSVFVNGGEDAANVVLGVYPSDFSGTKNEMDRTAHRTTGPADVTGPGQALWASSFEVTDDLRTRELALHYPFWDKRRGTESSAVEALFIAAPADLFVFAKRPQGGLAEGEPVLLLDATGDRAKVLRADGSTTTLRTDWLTTRREGALTLPKLAPIKLSTSGSDNETIVAIAYPEASVRDANLLHDAFAAEEAVRSCALGYRAKHDPTWGKDYDLVNLRTGQSLRDKISSTARAKCGGARADAVVQTKLAKARANREREQASLKAALEQKLK